MIKLAHTTDVRYKWNNPQSDHTNTRTLIIVPSYVRMNRIIRKLKQLEIDMDNVLFQKCGQSIAELTEDFKKNPHAILITTSWEGYEFTENNRSMLKNIIIPFFPVPPKDETRINLKNRLNGKDMTGVLIHDSKIQAIQKLMQGIGRGIRNQNDEVVLWFIDQRIVENISNFVPDRFSKILNLPNIMKIFREGEIIGGNITKHL